MEEILRVYKDGRVCDLPIEQLPLKSFAVNSGSSFYNHRLLIEYSVRIEYIYRYLYKSPYENGVGKKFDKKY